MFSLRIVTLATHHKGKRVLSRSMHNRLIKTTTTLHTNPVLQDKDSRADVGTLCGGNQLKKALDDFGATDQQRTMVDSHTYVSLIDACANVKTLPEGKQVHAGILVGGFEQNVFLGTKLVNMYANCGSLSNACHVFDKIAKPNIFLWNAMIRGHANGGLHEEALLLYDQMLRSGMQPDKFTFPCVLKACAGRLALQQGKRIHDFIITSGLESDVFVGNALVAMYAKCGSIYDGRQVFDKMSQRDSVSWNAMIACYAQNGHYEEALKLFRQMQWEGVKPDLVTIPSVLPACANLASIRDGLEIHDHIIRCGFESDVFVGNALVDMYAKCGNVQHARRVFDKMSSRNVVSWNAMIAGYAQNVHYDKALELFQRMQLTQLKSDAATFASVLSACAHLAALKQGKEIHDYIIRNGFDSIVIVGNALIAMYAKCGSIEDAWKVFDKLPLKNVVTWNTMIAGYAQKGYCDEALELFCQMEFADVKANPDTVASVLLACAHLADLHQGKIIHNIIIKNGFESNVFVGNALIDMYVKCESIDNAQRLFETMSKKDVVSWTAMIAGDARSGYCDEALKLFREMNVAGIKPDLVTVASVLLACSGIAALQQGKEIHGCISRRELESDIFVGNALIDMYAKCGSIEDARQLFDKMLRRDAVTWTAMIAGYGIHGHAEASLNLFNQMQQAGLKPDHITFIAVLSACSHAGFVDEGWQHFDCMSQDYHITPRVEHYACMVDLLGRSGHLNEAWNFIKNMPLEANAGMLGSLLGACRIHHNIEVGERAAELLFELEPENTGYYVLLSNIYAEAGMWGDVGKVRTLMTERGLKKVPGCSWIRIKNTVHAFFVGDRSHPQSDKIYAKLKILSKQMEAAGYVPDTNCVLHDV